MNFFELFQLPVAFTIDNNKLEQQLRQLQSQHHPDNQSDNESKKHAEKMSAVINQAYQTLKYPDSRASHLLELDEADNVGLTALKPRLQTWLDELSAQFNQAYQQQNWTQAIDFAQKLKFLVKIDKDLAKKVDELANSQNDDDLYV